MKRPLYYTPTIEEFHYGFEYEFKSNSDYGYHSKHDCKEWTKQCYVGGACDECDETYCIKRAIKGDNCEVRVKCLDEEDILELGWKKSSEYYFEFERSFDYSEITKFKLLFSLNELTGKSYYTAIFANIEIGDVKIDMIRLGFENIKNKSELKKIMQMLKIIE